MSTPAAVDTGSQGSEPTLRMDEAQSRPVPDQPPPAGDPRRYFDRQASELEYHARVLALAGDASLPLLERAKFLAIFTTLTDEFFRVRLAGLKEQEAAGVRDTSRGGHSPAEQIEQLSARFGELVTEARRLFDDEVLPGLAEAGVRIASWEELDEDQRKELDEVFAERIYPVLTPLAVGPAHPFPFISDLSLSIGVTFADSGGGPNFARIKVPPLLDRFVEVDHRTDERLFVPLEEVVGAHLSQLFPGREVEAWHTFRVTRNADYAVEDVDIEDLLDAVESELLERRFGRVVRLEVDRHVPERILAMFRRVFDISDADVYEMSRPLDLGALWEIHGIDRPELQAGSWKPVEVSAFQPENVFELLRDRDVLVQHPYDSFATTTLRFIERAADDPNVLAIKQTLYRTSGDSPIVRALIRAAEMGKQVAALVELKARFDEEANIRWAEQLEESGVHVVYGFVDLKTHTKTALVVRRDEDDVIRRYGHIATGNYNPSTAKHYEDLGLFTSDRQLTEDLTRLFNMLTGHSRSAEFQRLLVAPLNLKTRILELIRDQAHPEGRIVMKINNLSHLEVIDALYEASQAGARIDLIARGICCLRPGIPGLSETIRVRSLVGPFLEHSRILRFGHDPGHGEYLIGSADLMPRNLENRVEAVTPVDAPELRARLDEILEICLDDDELAWTLDADGAWTKVEVREGVHAQHALMAAAERRER